ncbi:MAG TPA: glycoside hydrolase family 38 C-terminal domain-containing protein [Gaiellales bacterium]|nr:glycoside hydrolase family 38 C-terminal domain-containing protein [Gaiellales bacterium]
MLRHPGYTRDRIAQVGDRIRAQIYPDIRDPDHILVAGPVDRIELDEAHRLDYRPCRLGERFGPLWATYWFHIRATVPEEWRGERVDLLWVSHSEATLWMDGRPLQGLNTSPDGARPDAMVLAHAAGGEHLDLHVELACNGLFGELPRPYASLEPVVLDRCQIARFDERAWRLHHDFDVLRRLEADAAQGLDPTWAGELLSELNRVCNVWSEDRALWDEAEAILAPLLKRRNATTTHELSAIGHAHIDTAWLWPLAETYRKAVRTFSSQLAYMERYPDFRFACSQAVQYDWIRRRRPDIWDRIRDRVAGGQWIVVGGTWVEPDCNLPSGESLVRQFVHGQRFFEREFGRRCTEFWNPDVFGYNGQLPQIMRGAGIDRFLTQKLSWNRFNRPPYHTFTWQGIDGSEVLAHFPPADTYNATADVAELRRSARDYKDHDRSRRSLLVFGYGDGGGGPTPAMLETLRRARDLEGLPRTTITTSEEFFDALAADADDLPTVVGELYFEYHRGTYTSQAAVKLGNRAGERALHDAEAIAVMALREAGAPYPAGTLADLWQLLLLNQFHDILPGSGIGLVYEDAARDHAAVLAGAEAVIDDALVALGAAGGERAPLNTLGFERAEVAERPGGEGLAWVTAPAYGVGHAAPRGPSPVEVAEHGDVVVLDNGNLRVEIDRDGSLRSLIDVSTGREALADPANRLQLFDDRPTEYEAWDIDPFHMETVREAGGAESCTVSGGGLRAEVELRYRIGGASTMRQVLRLDAGARRLEFHCEVDWRERRTMLKVLFPVAVRAVNATYQMQFGYTERPTHYSTSHDLARFEVPGHRFADLSEHGFGVALLTDCKYGYSTYANQMRISLLRGTTVPDPDADLGHHRFAYAVLPHAGGWREAGVVAEAARFETPVRWLSGDASPRSFLSIDDPNLVIDTVKRGEDADAVAVRLYEAHGGRGRARLSIAWPVREAVRCSLLEDPGEPLDVRDGAIEIPYGPHEIVSLLVR